VLIRFEVANFRSILDAVELSMVAIDRERDAARDQPLLGQSLLPVAAVYGPNASGKSNVLAALAWLCDGVRDSLRFWDDGIPVEPFAFSAGSERPSGFTVESIVDGVRFEYDLELDRNGVRYEGLFHYPEKKRRRIFEREGDDLKLQRGLGSLSGTRELLTEQALALSIARRFDEPLITGFVRDLLAVEYLSPRPLGPRRRIYSSGRSTIGWFQDERDRLDALVLLKLADLGVDDVVIEERTSLDGPVVRLVHRSSGERMPFDFATESEGTRTWFQLIGPVLGVLRSGSLLLFDELDGSLHPTLAMELIRLFHEPQTNPAGAQLVFTSHDTSLLNHLNRDEVWLTEKADNGSTTLGALSDFAGERVRRSQNLERAYLHGRFGALPDVDRTEVLRALGLIG
jgi:uncharacterized protein